MLRLMSLRRQKSYLTPRLIIEKCNSLTDFLTPKSHRTQFSPTLKYGEFKVSPPQPIPSNIVRPPYATLKNEFELRQYYTSDQIFAEIKSVKQIKLMKKAAQIAANCLKTCLEASEEGITAEEVDRIGHEFIIKNGAYPAGVGFHGFPKAICISVNEVACHGIPDNRPYKQGDIVSYDCTVFSGGVYGDCAGTACIGEVAPEVKALVQVAKECVDKAIEIVKPGTEFAELARVVNEHARKHGFGIIKEFGGHFIGEMMHMPPMISFNHPSKTPGCMHAGHVFTIEPIVSQGDPSIYTWPDGWSIVTKDSGFCAQFEHTVLVTPNGCQVLTLP